MRLAIEKAVYGGQGLARSDGQVVFVEGALPGEEVEARVTSRRRGFLEARLAEVITPSPQRIAPRCPHFERCGGCQYQHAAYPAQLAIKQAVLEESLERARVADLPAVRVHAAEPWQYRNRIRLAAAPGGALGYRERHSHAVVPIRECPVAAPLLILAALTLGPALAALGISVEEAELCCDAAESTLLLSLFAARIPGGSAARLEAGLRAEIPALAGITLWQSSAPMAGRGDRKGGARRSQPQPRLVETAGAPFLSYTVGGHVYRVSAGSFFQGNRFLLEDLVETVAAGQSGETAWDLFAGVGLFSLPLAAHFREVVAVEAAPASIADLGHNLAGCRARVVGESVLDFLRRPRRGRAPELIVADPPRAGLGEPLPGLLAATGAEQIVYVSCDPATFSRDAARLGTLGYRLEALELFDLFPQTFHLESVGRFRRRP